MAIRRDGGSPLLRRLFAIAILLPQACFAASNQLELNLGRGTPLSSIQTGGSSDRLGSRGTEWSADILHSAGGPVYLGLGGGQLRSNDNVSQTFVPNAATTIRSKISSVFVLSRLDLPTQTKLLPYFIAGVGWVEDSVTITSLPKATWLDTGTSERRSILDDSKQTVGFVTGLGLDYPLTDRLLIGVDARYQTSAKRTFNLTPQGAAITGQSSVQTPMNIFTFGVKAGIRY